MWERNVFSHHLYLHECSDPVSSFFYFNKTGSYCELIWDPVTQEAKGEAQAPPTVFYLIAEKSWSLYFYRLCLCFEMSLTE